VLFREVVVLIGGAIIVQALYYYGVIRINREHIIGSVYCLLMSVVIWTIFGLILVRLAIRKVQ
jgi:hypothetical protein